MTTQKHFENDDFVAKPPPPAVAKPTRPPALSEIVRNKIGSVLTGKKADDFVTAVVSLTNQDMALRECDGTSLVAAALQAQSLNLALHKSLGQAFIVPYKDNKNKVNGRPRVMATFQIGYKGYIQLAIRSGYYKKINVMAIKEGELKGYDPLGEDIDVELLDDAAAREKAPTLGYYCMFEYLNGFRKTMYWSKGKMETHALRYSQAYLSDKRNGYKNSFWTKDFDAMALKTMLRQILSKWGVMSVELQTAYESDYRIIEEDGAYGEVVDAEFVEAMAADTLPAQSEAEALPPPHEPETKTAEDPSPEPTPDDKPKPKKADTVESVSSECFDICQKLGGPNMNERFIVMFPSKTQGNLPLEDWLKFLDHLKSLLAQ